MVIVISSRVPNSGSTSDSVRCMMKSATWFFLSPGAHRGQICTSHSSPHTFGGVSTNPRVSFITHRTDTCVHNAVSSRRVRRKVILHKPEYKVRQHYTVKSEG